ncbi:MAG: response regulator [Pseudodesulfovibrio sp.]|nr:response regulator [Pseudodesulfovibrio sp.]
MTETTNTNTILVVDDQPANLQVLLTFLKQHGFSVLVADNGHRALKALEKEKKPDLILLDVMMPGMDGFETCSRIKENEAIADIPVIFMTALDSTEDKMRGFKAGGLDYITKPFQQAEVLARVKTHITLRQQKLELQQALDEVKQLKGILPICCVCKQIRDDKGYWLQVDRYISDHTDVRFSHGYCPDCYAKEVAKLDKYKQ